MSRGKWLDSEEIKLTQLALRFSARTSEEGEHWIWRNSTPEMNRRIKYKRKLYPVSWIAWFLATGEMPPEGAHVCHTCDIRVCVRNDEEGEYIVKGVSYKRYGHLWLGTASANAKDRDQKGRGRSQGKAPLSEDQKKAIRIAYKEGGMWRRGERWCDGNRLYRPSNRITMADLGVQYGCAYTTIHRIIYPNGYENGMVE